VTLQAVDIADRDIADHDTTDHDTADDRDIADHDFAVEALTLLIEEICWTASVLLDGRRCWRYAEKVCTGNRRDGAAFYKTLHRN
jgi:hypothetical protein